MQGNGGVARLTGSIVRGYDERTKLELSEGTRW